MFIDDRGSRLQLGGNNMFELCKYLDTIRHCSNNTIDSKRLIRVVRIGNDDNHKIELTGADLEYYLNLKNSSTELQWNNIELILEAFNDNWLNRQNIQNQLEEYFKKGSFKLADEYFLQHIGGLKYLTQFQSFKKRFVSKCDFILALENSEIENADILFDKHSNSDLVDMFEEKRSEAIKKILSQIDKLIYDKMWDDAEKLFDKNIKYIEYDYFDEYLEKYSFLLEPLINNTNDKVTNNLTNRSFEEIFTRDYPGIHFDYVKKSSYFLEPIINKTIDKIIHHLDDQNFEEIFTRDYPSIPFDYVKEKYISLIHEKFSREMIDLNIETSRAILNTFYNYFTTLDYLEIFENNFSSSLPLLFDESKLLDCLKSYIIILTPSKIPYNDLLSSANNIIIKKYPESKYNLPISYKKLLKLYLINLFNRNQFDDANLIHHYNKEYLSLVEYNNVKRITITSQINSFLNTLPESYNHILRLYQANTNLLSESLWDKVQKQYTEAITKVEVTSRIQINIDKLRKLSKVFIGIHEQYDIKNDLLNKLRYQYKNHAGFFNDLIIEDIKQVQLTFDPDNYKNLHPNIKLEPSNCIEDAVFFHKTEFYIASYVREDFHSTILHYVIRPYKGHETCVPASNLIKVGTLIRDSSYHSHCYNCKEAIDGRIQMKCPKCSWYICSNCGACGCGYNDYDY